MLTGGILNAFMWTDFCSCLPNFTPVPSRYVSSRIIKPIFMGFIMRKKTLLLLAEFENGL